MPDLVVKLLRAQVAFGFEKVVEDDLSLPGDLEFFLLQIGGKNLFLLGQFSINSHFAAYEEGALNDDWFGQDRNPAKYNISSERATTGPSGCQEPGYLPDIGNSLPKI